MIFLRNILFFKKSCDKIGMLMYKEIKEKEVLQ